MNRRSSSSFPIILLAIVLLVVPSLARAQSPSPYLSIFGKNKVQYRNFKWKIYHSPHFDVYYYTEQEELLQKVVSFAESAYDSLSQEFDYQIQKPTSLVFYETHSAFEQNNEIPNFIPEGIGAFATDVRKRMFMPVDLPDPELWALMLHELTHIFQYYILFGGNTGRGVAAGAPQWLMEGMASFMEGEESARDKMFVRDAVVNDMIPPITQGGASGFFAYRFGYAVFEFMVEKWGREGFRDFLIEFRNTLGGRVGRAIERAFQMSPADFDAEFRRWLRKQYLTELVETGEPSDFGRGFLTKNPRSLEISPTAAPSGDLVAAFTTTKGDVDVALFDTQRRAIYKDLTKGLSAKYQYYVAQEFTLGRKQGRDLTYSPDGNKVAFFARRNRGRHLVIVNAIKGGIIESIPMDIEQQYSPTWSPDGRKIAFQGWQAGNFDIFEIDLETREIVNLTNDYIYDAAPAYSPDGKSLALTSTVGGYNKIFRIDLDNPTQRIPLREGLRSQTNETDPTFSPDGQRVYFTSDGSGANNIYSFDLESGLVQQHTNAMTGCFQPTVLRGPTGKDRVVYSGYWKGAFDLYLLDVDDPITPPTTVTEEQIAEAKSYSVDELPRFEPSIEVTIDEANESKYRGRKFYLQDVVGGTIGVSDDQTFIAQIGFFFNDFLGDRRIIAIFQSVSSLSNFDVIYQNLSRRVQWQAHLFDHRDYYTIYDPTSPGGQQRLDNALALTGLEGSVLYPLGVNHRIQAGLGYYVRDINFAVLSVGPDGQPVIGPRKDDYPQVSASIVGDTAVGQPWGYVNGRRYRFWGSYAPDLDDTGDSSALTAGIGMDFRQYFMLSRRTNFAFRLWGASNQGNAPTPIYIGGLDTIRGFPFRSIVGTRAFYSNIEFRFPLIDFLALPFMAISNIRGNIFLDIGGAYYQDFQDELPQEAQFECWNSETNALQDCVSSYGWGVSFRLFGLDLNWDFSQQWDLNQTISDSFETSFWIGPRF